MTRCKRSFQQWVPFVFFIAPVVLVCLQSTEALADQEKEALAERIFTLLLDDKCRQELGRQAREYALAYDWPDIARKILRVYASLFTTPLASSNVVD